MATTKVGKLIDQLYDFQLKIDEINLSVKKLTSKIDELKKKYAEKEKEIFDSFDKQDIEGAIGSKATASISRQIVANVEDWDKLYTYIGKTKSFDLLQRRINNTAYRDRLNNGKAVPGVSKFTKISLSLKKKKQ